jgi:Glycine zipper
MRGKSVLLGLAFLSLTGCQTQNQTNGAVGGGLIGGALGLGVGALTHNPAAGLAIGAGTGALVGTAVGADKDIREAKAAQQQAQAYAAAHPPLQLTEVVQLSSQGVPPDQIMRQIVNTNSYYNLTPADLQYLNNERVSPTVIALMQQRTPGAPVMMVPARPVYYAPPPVAVGIGFGR